MNLSKDIINATKEWFRLYRRVTVEITIPKVEKTGRKGYIDFGLDAPLTADIKEWEKSHWRLIVQHAKHNLGRPVRDGEVISIKGGSAWLCRGDHYERCIPELPPVT